MSKRENSLAILVAFALGACAPLAGLHGDTLRAPVAREDTARLYDDGVAAYTRGEYARAEGLFARAYAIAPAPATLFNLARVHDTEGHDARAARMYLAYARLTNGADERTAVDAALARLRPRLSWVAVRGAHGAVVLDDERLAGEELAAPVPVLPAVHTVRVGGGPAVAVAARLSETTVLDFNTPNALVLVSAEPAPDARAAVVAVSAR